jgi:uncharacterized protein (TIGR03435 family)
LKDVYSFNLRFETPDYTPPPGTPEPTESLPTIFQALGRQGLKLTRNKRVMADFLVIDHVDKSPKEN